MIIHRYNKHIYVYIRMLLHTDISHICTYAHKQHVHTHIRMYDHMRMYTTYTDIYVCV